MKEKNNKPKYIISKDKISIDFGHNCIVCENKIELSKPMCDECLNALKSLILEKRANSKK